MKTKTTSLARGFTLVELLVVIAVIATLSTLSVSAVLKMIDKARTSTCMSNLRQVGIFMNTYAADNNGFFPRGGENGYIRNLCSDAFPTAYPNTGGMKDAPFFEDSGSGGCFVCPHHRRKSGYNYGKSYLGNPYIMGSYKDGEPINDAYTAKSLASVDDASRTFLIMEDWSKDNTKLWRANDMRYKPNSEEDNFNSHDEGSHVLFADGHVEFLKQDPALGDEDAFDIHYRGKRLD